MLKEEMKYAFKWILKNARIQNNSGLDRSSRVDLPLFVPR